MSLGALVWTTVAAAAAYRAIVRPARAVFDAGEVTSCAGASRQCEPVMTIRSTSGPDSRVYALVAGTISRVTGETIELIAADEPVIVGYVGRIALAPGVAIGQRVHAGLVLGRAASIGLAVMQITRLADGRLALAPMEPASWLAGRGLRAATKLSPSTMWCAGGRKLIVPQDAAHCGLRLPDPPGFSLLPVSVQVA